MYMEKRKKRTTASKPYILQRDSKYSKIVILNLQQRENKNDDNN